MTKRQVLLAGASSVLLALVLFIGIWWWQENNDPFAANEIVDPPFTSLTYTYHVFFWWNPYDQLHAHWVRGSNFTHVKQVFAWEDIQPWHDQWEWKRADEILGLVEQNDLEIVVRLSDAPDWAHPDIPGKKNEDYHDAPPTDPADFANFCGAVASRYPGRIKAYQIWNEPNLTREWGNQPPNAAEYVELLAACSNAIRTADPEAIIISAGLSPTGNDDAIARRDDLYLQDMYNAGFQQYVDVVGAHAAGFSDVEYGPDDAERDGRGRWATFRRIEDLRKIMVANGDGARQMAILEMGWPLAEEKTPRDYAWFAVDEQKQADNLIKAYEYAYKHWNPWVGLMTTIYIADPAWTEEDEEFYFAVTMPNNWTRKAFRQMANSAKYCGDTIIPARDPGSREALDLVPSDACS